MNRDIQLRVERSTLKPFSSAVIGSALSLSGMLVLIRVSWTQPSGPAWGFAGFALLLLLLIYQLRRIHALYESLDIAMVENDPMLRRALNETVRTFTWGNAIFLLLALAVFQFHLLH